MFPFQLLIICNICLFMVTGTSSTRTGIPNLGCSEEGNYSVHNSSVVIRHSCESSTAKRQASGAPLQLDSSALLLRGLLCTALVFALCRCALAFSGLLLSVSDWHLQCFSTARECTLRARGELSNMESSAHPPTLASWLVCSDQMTPNPHSLIRPKGTVLIGQNRATLVGWSCTPPVGWESLNPIGWNRIPRPPL